MTTIESWAKALSNVDLVKEYTSLYFSVEVQECFNAKDFSQLVAVEHEIINRGGDCSIFVPHVKGFQHER